MPDALWLLQKKSHGSVLLEQVFYHLDILEKDYFGLQYTDHYNVNVSSLYYVYMYVYMHIVIDHYNVNVSSLYYVYMYVYMHIVIYCINLPFQILQHNHLIINLRETHFSFR